MDAAFTDDEILETSPLWDIEIKTDDSPIQWNSFGPVEKLVRADSLTHTNTLYLVA